MRLHFQTKTIATTAFTLGILALASQAAQAAAPVILNAAINAPANEISIVGRNFTTGGNPIVKLNDTQLVVVTQTNTFILANLPTRLMNATYELTVSNGTVTKFNVAMDFRFGTNTSLAVAGNGATCTLGEIHLVAGVVANGTPAQGQLIPINSNTPLFSLLGTTYGGDGVTNFALPDLRAVAPNGLTYAICDQGVFPSER